MESLSITISLPSKKIHCWLLCAFLIHLINVDPSQMKLNQQTRQFICPYNNYLRKKKERNEPKEKAKSPIDWKSSSVSIHGIQGIPRGMTKDSLSPSSPQEERFIWKMQVHVTHIPTQIRAPIPDLMTSAKI